jgi:hypothetical protein
LPRHRNREGHRSGVREVIPLSSQPARRKAVGRKMDHPRRFREPACGEYQRCDDRGVCGELRRPPRMNEERDERHRQRSLTQSERGRMRENRGRDEREHEDERAKIDAIEPKVAPHDRSRGERDDEAVEA